MDGKGEWDEGGWCVWKEFLIFKSLRQDLKTDKMLLAWNPWFIEMSEVEIPSCETVRNIR